MEITVTNPNEKNYNLFLEVQKKLYPESKNKFLSKNSPERNHLKSCYVLSENNIPKARFAYYENYYLKYKNKRACCIGSYECINNSEIAEKIIKFAIELARKNGFEYLIAPMEGSTWDNYRFSIHNDKANFFMEPEHHTYYNQQFTENGFEEIAHYYSNIDKNPTFDDDLIFETEKCIKNKGGIIRHIDINDFENELYKIAKFSIESFKNNFLYTPITPEYFVRKYINYKHIFIPELIQIIEKDDEIQGLTFALPNLADPDKKSIIGKTVARKQDSPFSGIGNYFAANMNKTALQFGYSEVIHALIISDNASRKISKKSNGKFYKEYKLYGISVVREEISD